MTIVAWGEMSAELVSYIRIALNCLLLAALFLFYFPTLSQRSKFLGIWLMGLLCLASIVSYLNFCRFHGRRNVHVHDFYHYFFDVKYARELGYFNLNRAGVVAAAELGREQRGVKELRNLRTYVREEVDLEKFKRVKRWFSPERWKEFKRDLDFYFRLSPNWPKVLNDNGNCAPPMRNAFVSPLLNALPLNYSTLRLFVNIDMVLLFMSFVLVGCAFGLKTLLLCLSAFCLMQTNGFAWIGGTVLRYDWLYTLLAGIAFLRLRRFYLASVFLMYAVLTRIFPLCFILVLAAKYVLNFISGRADDNLRTLLKACAFAAAIIALIAFLNFPEKRYYAEYLEKLEVHSIKRSINRVSFTEIVQVFFADRPDSWYHNTLQARGIREPWISRVLGVIFFLCLLKPINRTPLVPSLQYGLILIYFGGHITNYYYSFMMLFFLLPFASKEVHIFDFVKMTCVILLSLVAYIMGAAGASLLQVYSWMSVEILFFYALVVVLDNLKWHGRMKTWYVVSP